MEIRNSVAIFAKCLGRTISTLLAASAPDARNILHDLGLHVDLPKFVMGTSDVFRESTYISLMFIVARDSPQKWLTSLSRASKPSIASVLDLVPKAHDRDQMQEMTGYHILAIDTRVTPCATMGTHASYFAIMETRCTRLKLHKATSAGKINMHLHTAVGLQLSSAQLRHAASYS
jgi:hypothetical protein